jgi:hypothetical protein
MIDAAIIDFLKKIEDAKELESQVQLELELPLEYGYRPVTDETKNPDLGIWIWEN